jgi:hypothetical protein
MNQIEPPDPSRVTRLTGSFHAVKGAWSGTSYGYHPHGVVRRGIIFIDHHNVSGSHDAHVILEPDSELIYPPTDADSSRCGSQSKACIRPKSGGTVCVYQNGRWVGPDGPWRKIIHEILDELDSEVAALKEAERLAEEERIKAIRDKEADQFEKARLALAHA